MSRAQARARPRASGGIRRAWPAAPPLHCHIGNGMRGRGPPPRPEPGHLCRESRKGEGSRALRTGNTVTAGAERGRKRPGSCLRGGTDEAPSVAGDPARAYNKSLTFLSEANSKVVKLHLRKSSIIPISPLANQELKSVQQFNYLGSLISLDGEIDGEIDNRLAKAYSAFGKLHKRVWRNKHLKKSTKISVYRAIVLSTLLYGSESWVIYSHHLHLLERFHQRCLRTILNIHWSDYVTNTSVLEQAAVTSIEAMLLRTQLRWAGHISRMKDHRLPKILLYGELATGCHKRGALKRRYKDSLKQYLSLGHIINVTGLLWPPIRRSGDTLSINATDAFEKARRITLEGKRQCRKNHGLQNLPPKESFCCAFCSRTCLSCIGLFSHQCACHKRG
ncbi:uncharacterized protein LOC127471424 [Manacus candei]|uniref:uncharacterized protein LOC127471424 n=1 Tax=Manacus candei TaxID=415023 RepID=UPI00222797DF|nr:uncharacterized protein LOC127471424 [Manacus candei]